MAASLIDHASWGPTTPALRPKEKSGKTNTTAAGTGWCGVKGELRHVKAMQSLTFRNI
jgi:hypothetical protein